MKNKGEAKAVFPHNFFGHSCPSTQTGSSQQIQRWWKVWKSVWANPRHYNLNQILLLPVWIWALSDTCFLLITSMFITMSFSDRINKFYFIYIFELLFLNMLNFLIDWKGIYSYSFMFHRSQILVMGWHSIVLVEAKLLAFAPLRVQACAQGL